MSPTDAADAATRNGRADLGSTNFRGGDIFSWGGCGGSFFASKYCVEFAYSVLKQSKKFFLGVTPVPRSVEGYHLVWCKL